MCFYLNPVPRFMFNILYTQKGYPEDGNKKNEYGADGVPETEAGNSGKRLLAIERIH